VGMKGVVVILELVIVILILLSAFVVFFPKFAYESKWEDALLLLKGRDAILAMDRNGTLYENSLNLSSLLKFLDKIFPKESLIFLPSVEGIIKTKILVACNCTDEDKKTLSDWLSGPKGKAILRINERDINFDICTTLLEDILNPCGSKTLMDTDVLVIYGKKNFGDKQASVLKKYLEKGNGIIEVRDFSSLSEIQNDVVQREIFGLSWVESVAEAPSYDEFSRKPRNVTDIIYVPWKFFYHIPINLEYVSSEDVAGCSYQPSAKGILTFNRTSYTFWICDSNSIWLDKNGDGLRDEIVTVGRIFQIAGYNFLLSYIRDNVSIGVSFKPTYNFSDFLKVDGSTYHIEPSDGNRDRVLLVAKPQNLPVVILNLTPISRVAWIANFSEDGVGDDERLLFISLLLWASNKREFWIREVMPLTEFLRVAYFTSYVNAVNRDMFEVYKFRLGVGYPYK
jgi:hypothetical protein